MSRIRALIIKEFIAVWQDKKSRVILILPPLVQFCIFTFAATLDVRNVPLAVWNQDAGLYSRDFLQQLEGARVFNPIVRVEKAEEIKEALDLQKVLLAIVFHESFSRDILAGRPASLQILVDGRRSNSAQIAQGYIQEMAERFSHQLAPSGSRGVEMVSRFFYNPNLYYPWFTLTGLVGVLSMLTSLGVSALSVARERETGTLDQLLVTPMNSTEILIGKALPAILIGIFEGLLMLSLGVLFLNLTVQGSIALLVLGLATFIPAVVGVGLFISSLAQTQQQATLGLFLMLVPTVMLSGFATPVENMPHWLQVAAQGNPLKYFLIISRGVCMKGMSFYTVLHHLWPMVIIALSTLTTSTWFFRRKIA